MDLEKYLPSVISLSGVVMTMVVSLWLGLIKQKVDVKTVSASADAGIRDDLIEINEHLNSQIAQREEQIKTRDEKIEKRDQHILQLQQVIADQIVRITDLTLEAKQKDYYLKEKDLTLLQLRAELDKFNKKVYYIREIATDETGDKHEP